MFSIFIGQQLELLRDKATLFFVLLFPSALVFVLGTMLVNLDNPDMEVEPFELAYVIDSDDPVTVGMAEAVIAQFDEVEQIEFTAYDNLASVEGQLARGELGAAVLFTEPFAIEIHEGQSATKNHAVRTIFEGVARLHGSVTAASAAAAAQPTQLAAVSAPTADPVPLNTPLRVEEKTYGVSRTMMDYYAVTMIVMMFFMGSATAGAMTFYSLRKDGTLQRLVASPQSRVSSYLQILLGQLPLNLATVAIVMLVSSTLFGAQYASSWQLNVLLLVMLAVAGFAFSALFLVLGMFIRVNPMVVLMPAMWIVLFLSGTYSKEIFVDGLTQLMPPYLIQTAAFDLTLFGNIGQAIMVLAVSFAVIVASTLVGAALFNRKDVTS
jgi:ABC-2 type transport system permease protein